MAIDQIYFEFLSKAIKMIAEDKSVDKSTFKIGCLSYPDLLVSREQVVDKFPNLKNENFIIRTDTEEIKKWHGMPNLNEIIETTDFFKKLNCETDYFDFEEIRGGEIITDLNFPVENKYHNNYDLIIDTGTLEHCFNVAVAFENMCKLAKIGGIILTAAPMTKINHGFWNFSPCAYQNYFEQNNFKILYLGGFYKNNGEIKNINIDPNARKIYPAESILICVVRKMKNSKYDFPIQKKYIKNF